MTNLAVEVYRPFWTPETEAESLKPKCQQSWFLQRPFSLAIEAEKIGTQRTPGTCAHRRKTK